MTAMPMPAEERPVLLAVSTLPLWPDADGFSLRAINLLRELSRSWRVVLVARSPEATGWAAAFEALAAVHWVEIGRGFTYLPGDFDAGALTNALREACRTYQPAVALLWGGAEACIAGVPGFPPAIGDRVDSLALTAARDVLHPVGLRPMLRGLQATVRYAAYEAGLRATLAGAVVVGDDDARALRRLTRGMPVHVVGNGVLASDGPAFECESADPTVVFSGTLDYPPNVDAAIHFARDVWPTVRRHVPKARYRIVGRRPVQEIAALGTLPGVEVVGAVPDMAAELRRAWLAVAPMRQGAGIKNKVLEAWGVGRPVVMSATATNGLRVDAEQLACIANGPQAFAAVTARLLGEATERHRLGTAALAMVRERFSWDGCAVRLSGILREAAAR